MTAGAEWVVHARELISPGPGGAPARPSQVELRRAVSAAYYGLFHTLALAGSSMFGAGGGPLRFQATRAFSHAAMRKVCAAYVRTPLKPFPPGYEHLNTPQPTPELLVVARAFDLLQEGRFLADYDLSVTFELEDVERLVELAEAALVAFSKVQAEPGTVVFLTALLLSDRWTRRG